MWAEIGEYLGLGLKKGLEDEQDNVLKTVSNLAQSVTDEFDVEEATLQVDAEGSDMVSHLSNIADKLSGIVAAFRGINEYLSNIEALRIPYIATGEEIPYKTRISASTEPNSTILEMSSDLDETLSDHSYLLRRILELLERAKFGIDNDELAQAIAFALRGATRGYGGA